MKHSVFNSRMQMLLPILAGTVLFIAMPTLNAGEVDPELMPGSSGDTTADFVLGQLDFVHNARNFIDERGLNSSANDIGDVAIDKSVTPNRVYIADRRNHRVLGWQTIAAFTTHAAADIVIGQPDFISNVCNNGGITAASLCSPSGVAVDSAGNLYVADSDNSRVLYYQKPFARGVDAGITADDVFGQYSSFTSNAGNAFGLSADSLWNPVKVVVDGAKNLFIADYNNNRVLEFNTPEAITTVVGSGDTTADRVFGQLGDFASNVCRNGGITRDSLCNPWGLALDAANNLYIADHNNNRVLKYNTPLTTDTRADKVYGQGNVFDTNDCNKGGVSANSLCFPAGVTVDPAGAVYISDRSNHRVLAYPATGGTTANKVLGQFGSFTTNACNNTGGTFDSGANPKNLCYPDGLAMGNAVSPNSPNLYASDAENNRVLQYKPSGSPLTIKSDQAAQGVLGQALLTTRTEDFIDGRGFAMTDNNDGAVAIDRSVNPNRIYVSDPPNNRVLAWSSIAAFTTHAPATLVFGQPNLFTNVFNNGGISKTSLNHPRGLAVDSAGNLYVADQNNHRVLIYNNPFATDTAADKVIGQVGFTSNGCNLGGITAATLCTPIGVALDGVNNLYVGDFSNNRVLKYNAPLTNAIADKVYGQGGSFTSGVPNLNGVSANSLSGPHGVALDAADNLYVADYNNHRVLEFDKLPLTNSTADIVFGQGNSFTSNVCNRTGVVTADNLCRPRFVTTIGTAVFIADTDNQRVLKYNAPLTTNTTADRVFGQGNLFTTNGCKTLSPATLCVPEGVAADANSNLYVVDSDNNRVLEFLKP